MLHTKSVAIIQKILYNLIIAWIYGELKMYKEICKGSKLYKQSGLNNSELFSDG